VSFEKIKKGGVVFYRSAMLDRLGVPHAFSTRLGGVSLAPFDTLNLGNPTGCDQRDSDEHLAENYRRLHAAADLADRRRIWVFQSHGPRVVEVASGVETGAAVLADGLITAQPEVALAVRYADCAPVLLADPQAGRVAALHIGWRGASTGIIENAIALFGGGREVRVAIGPCIGANVFEVGEEVIDVMPLKPVPAVRSSGGKWKLDLSTTIRRLLAAAGVRDQQIDESHLCTVERPGEFFSHRRDGLASGRMAALIALPAAAGRAGS
jgi:YfiH family protein